MREKPKDRHAKTNFSSTTGTVPAGKGRVTFNRDSQGSIWAYAAQGTANEAITLPALVQEWVANSTSGTSVAATLGSAPTSGNRILGIVASIGRGANSITQTNVSWTQLATFNGNNQWIEFWLGVVSASANATATANFTGVNASDLIIAEIAQAFSTAGTPVTSTGNSTETTVPYLTADAGDYVLAGVSSNTLTSNSGALISCVPCIEIRGSGHRARGLLAIAPSGQINFYGFQSAAVAWSAMAVVIS